MEIKKPELLAPAGGRAALEAAIDAGADAVYLGAWDFNARMRAENFNRETLGEALALAHAHGVKTYVTLNTRLFDGELSEALSLAHSLYCMGVTALIVADMGLARLIRKYIPDLEIHASTQLSGHNLIDAKELCDVGFTRMVCQREIDLAGLNRLCKNSPIEIEMFIHGAYCVSFSGQCLMSSVMGGRSGNRGECAQPCRQPYCMGSCPTDKKVRDYPISLKDMCLASHMREIMASGVASLKIEGRQKPAEYVWGVTKIYRRLIDENRNATAEELDTLRRIFSRDGFSDGYFKGDGRNMRGVRTYEDYLEMDKTKFAGLTKKVPLKVSLRAVEGESAQFTVKSPFGEAVAETESPLTAGGVAPLTKEGAEKNAGRLGATPYVLDSFTFEGDGVSPLTLSELNRLRRSAVEKLMSVDREFNAPPVISFDKRKPEVDVVYTAEFLYPDRVSKAAKEFFKHIYLPYGVGGDEFDVSLPPYMPDGAEVLFDDVRLLGKHLLCHTTGQLKEALRRGFSVGASLRANVFNSAAAEYYGEGADFVCAAPEMSLGRIRRLSSASPVGAVVYGRLPLMLCVRCAISDGGEKCKLGCGLHRTVGEKIGTALCESVLYDRKRTAFPLYGMPDCTNVIYNSVPLYMGDKMNEVKNAGVRVMHFIFTDEPPEKCDKIIEAYKTGRAAPEGMAIRRML